MITETKSGIATFWGSFSEPLIFIFGKDLVSLIFKSLLTFTAFVNYEGPYFAEGFLLNLRPCFDIAFAQLGVIPRTTNKFVEIAAAAECYLITNHVKNIKEAAVRNMTSCKTSWWKNVSEKGKKLFTLNLQHF